MLPFTNVIADNQTTLWDRDALLAHLNMGAGTAELKKLERLTAEASYYPATLQPDGIRDHQGHPLHANLLAAEIDAIQARRGKWLAIQLWQFEGRPDMICANDGRGGRRWLFANAGQTVADHLGDFCRLLTGQSQHPILMILHGPLAALRHDLPLTGGVKCCQTPYREIYNSAIPTKLTPAIPATPPSHLDRLEAESLHIIREVVAETQNPVMLYSIGKDSAVMLHLARKAFWPGTPPFPLLHVDTGWKFRAMYEFRDQVAASSGMELRVHQNLDGVRQGINPFDHGSALHTDIMKTQGLKQALEAGKFDAAFGGARRDEEKSRAKERIFSFRTKTHQWDPKNQRPELWNLYNTRVANGESMRVFPLSNWTEIDIWSYIYREAIPIVPLYFAAERPVIERDGTLMMVDDERLSIAKSEKVALRKVRFRTLGCYPLTGAIESTADTLESIILELLTARQSERQGRTIDKDANASMEQKKMEGYF
jgi:sulfate adenylyltransferase subunit 2